MNKKELERIYLDRFDEVFGNFPKGEISKSEAPDFLVTTDDGKLGIEITRLYHKSALGASPQKEQESLRAMILNRTKKTYDGLDLPPIHVSVSFNDSTRLRKSDIDRLAKKLAALGQKLLPEFNASKEEEYDWDNRDYFPEEVDRVSTLRFKALTKSFWGAGGGGLIPELSAENLQGEIDKKDPKVGGYRKSCSTIWLLLCCNGEGASSWFDLSSEAAAATYHCRFDRVFWFSFQGKVHDLKIIR